MLSEEVSARPKEVLALTTRGKPEVAFKVYLLPTLEMPFPGVKNPKTGEN